MSRTLKDRPDWVKNNDKSYSFKEEHNHEHAGEPIYGYEIVKDENGSPIIETYTYRGFIGFHIYNHFEGKYELYDTWEELKAVHGEDKTRYLPSSAPYFMYRRYGDVQGTREKTELIITGYRPSECTIDDFIPRENKWGQNKAAVLCERELPVWQGGYPPCRRHNPTLKDREGYHRASRSNERDALHKLKSAANAGYDYEDADMDEDVFFKRQRRRRGWWC